MLSSPRRGDPYYAAFIRLILRSIAIAMRLEGWGGHMVRDGASRLLTMRPR